MNRSIVIANVAKVPFRFANGATTYVVQSMCSTTSTVLIDSKISKPFYFLYIRRGTSEQKKSQINKRMA